MSQETPTLAPGLEVRTMAIMAPGLGSQLGSLYRYRDVGIIILYPFPSGLIGAQASRVGETNIVFTSSAASSATSGQTSTANLRSSLNQSFFVHQYSVADDFPV